MCGACGQTGDAVVSSLGVVTTRGETVTYARCPRCGFLQVEPLPDPGMLASYYDADYYGLGETKFAAWMDMVRGLCLKRRAARVHPLVNRDRIRALDIGAGDGRFLRAMRDAGCECWGTELAGPAFERAARVPGLHMISGEVALAGLESRFFDVVTIWHVLEHVTAPAAMLHCCYDLLRDGGVLVVEVPHLGSWQSAMVRDKAFHLDPPRHLYQFTAASLDAMLAGAGFVVQDRETASLEMGVIGALQSWLNVIICPRDLFYDMLRTRNRCAGTLRSKLASIFLAVLLTPLAFVFTLLEAACGRGPVLRVFCRKPESDCRP